jgi:4-amino-4-deoxy-L-arabinose transferase-like glycosyltransferase
MLYALAGVPLATFHGDEPMQIYMSGDYFVTFIERAPARLMTQPPYDIDSDGHLRILNGSVNRYSIGLFWHLAGYATADLPPRPGWDWGLSYADNVATHHRPDERQLLFARLPSALLLCASYVILFGLAERIGRRGLAYGVTLLFALSPIILLNGRRALQEGALLCFGLLCLYCAQILANHDGRRHEGNEALSSVPVPSWLRSYRLPGVVSLPWVGLTVAAALTLASKHSGIVFLAAAYGWVAVAPLRSQQVGVAHSQRLIRLLRPAAKLSLSAAAALALFWLMSPSLWNDPLARAGDLLRVRAELLDIQVNVDPLAPMTLSERITAIVTQPFIAPLAHFEASPFDVPPIHMEIARYMISPLSGITAGLIGGGALTLLSFAGVIALCVPRWRPIPTVSAAGLLVWMAVVIISLLANPLPWQRYYLPLIPLAALLAGVGTLAVWRLWSARGSGRNIYANPARSARQ